MKKHLPILIAALVSVAAGFLPQDSTEDIAKKLTRALLAEAKAEADVAETQAEVDALKAELVDATKRLYQDQEYLERVAAARRVLEKQYENSLQKPKPPTIDVESMTMAELKQRARRHRPSGEGRTIQETPPLLPGGAVTVKDATYSPGWQWALNAALGSDLSKPLRSIELVNLGLGPRPPNDPLLKWFARFYHVEDLTVTDSECVGTLKWTDTDIDPARDGIQLGLDAWPKEHFIYASVSGDSTFRDCYIQDIGGQAFQVVNRSYPYQQYLGDNSPKVERTTHLIERVGIVDSGFDASRGSYAITYFDPGTPKNPARITLREVDVVQEFPRWRDQNDWRWSEEPQGSRPRRAEGMLVVASYDAAKVVAQEQVQGPMVTNLLVEDSVFARGVSDKPFIQLDGVRRVVFRRCHFRQPEGSAAAQIDRNAQLRELLGTVQEVRFEDCTSQNVTFQITTDVGVRRIDPHCPGAESVYRR